LTATIQRPPPTREPVTPRRRRLVIWLGIVVAALIVLALAGALRLYQVSKDLKTARSALVTAEAAVRQGNLGVAEKQLQVGNVHVLAANSRLHGSRELAVAGLLPVIHQNLNSLRTSVGLVFEMANGGQQVLAAAGPLKGPDGKLAVSLNGGQIPLATVQAVQTRLQDLALKLPGQGDAPHGHFLVGPVRKLEGQVNQEAIRRRRQFYTVANGLNLLTDMSGARGPRHYLIAVGNAAEMRGTGGMILSYAVLSGTGGRFTLDRVGPIDQIALPAPVTLPNPPDYVTRFANLGPTVQWRNANLGADFTSVAPVLETMYRAATGNTADGVIQIDSMGLAGLLQGIGPVQVPDIGEVNANNVVPLTLNELYVRFPDRPVRQEYLAAVAETAFGRLVSGNFSDLRPLADGLARAVRDRDVMFNAADSDDDRIGTQLGAAGGLPSAPDFAALTVQNLSGNKLDYYVDTHLGITGTRRVGTSSNVRVTIDLSNTAPPNGTPPYIFGPFNSTLQPGEYVGLVSLYVPSGTRLLQSSAGDASPPAATSEDGRAVISFQENVGAGQRKSVTLDLALPPQPPGAYGLTLVSPARVRPTTASVDLDVDGMRLRRDVSLNTPVTLGP
jgi:hypothetical protein